MRLSTDVGGRHRLTIPRHPTLRIGTLSGIVAAVAKHHGLSREILVARLFR
jgi:hypothetical protein